MTTFSAATEVRDDALFRRLVESVHEYAIFALDVQGHVVTWNPGAQRIKGYEASEIIGQHFSRFYPDGTSRDRLDAELRTAVKDGHFEEENWRVRKDGSRFWANVVITPIYSDGELAGFTKVTRDLTARLRHDQERAEFIAKEARARAEVSARDAFLSVAAHELRTPMTTARAAVQMLIRAFRGRSDLEPAQVRYLELVNEQVDKLGNLVNRLLETVQIQNGRLTLLKERTDVAGLIRKVVAQLGRPADQVISVTGPSALFANVDPLRFEQVVTNLLTNAIKFGLGRPISVGIEQDASAFRLTVRDHGSGIPEHQRAQVFERFFQANRDRSGMGLGLFISKEITESHGGAIAFECPADGGTQFTVTLPT
jgi:PAS domain S-box-containing protein